MSSRLRLTGGTSTQPAATRDEVHARDSNIFYLPQSPSSFISPPAEIPSDKDQEFAALIFGGICAGPLIVLSIILFYLAS